MKITKILLTIILFIFTINLSFAEDENINKIYKIYSYEYDEFEKIYDVYSYGSAILVGKNKILTNAHVIMGKNETVKGNYEICKTIDFKEEPDCFSIGKLLYYNTEKDLALLEIEEEDNNIPVSISTGELSIGDEVSTYGYPSNGGKTITFTQGKISGFTEGYYKIDASIDSGSSGGGAFNSKGELVGITTFVSTGHTTLGYILPIGDINNFLNKKGEIKIYSSNNDEQNDFKKYIEKYNSIIDNNFIDNKYVKISNLEENGYFIYNTLFDGDGELLKYYLTSESGNTEIRVGNLIYSGNKDLLKDKKVLKNISDNFAIKKENVININKEIFVKNKNFNVDITFNYKTKYLKFDMDYNNFSYVIEGNLEEIEEFKKALILLKKYTDLKTDNTYIKNTINFGGLSIKNLSTSSIVKYVSSDYRNVAYGILKFEGENYGLINFNKYRISKLEDYGSSKEYIETLKNNLGVKYITLSKFDDKSVYFVYSIYDRINNVYIYYFTTLIEKGDYLNIYNILVTTKNDDIKTRLEVIDFIGNISLPSDGKLIYDKNDPEINSIDYDYLGVR